MVHHTTTLQHYFSCPFQTLLQTLLSHIDTLISPSVWAATNGAGSCYGDGYGTRWSGERCTMMRGRGRSGSGCCGGLRHGTGYDTGYDTGLRMGGDVIVYDKENTIHSMFRRTMQVSLQKKIRLFKYPSNPLSAHKTHSAYIAPISILHS